MNLSGSLSSSSCLADSERIGLLTRYQELTTDGSHIFVQIRTNTGSEGHKVRSNMIAISCYDAPGQHMDRDSEVA